MLAKSAVRAYLEQEWDNFAWVKRADQGELIRAVLKEIRGTGFRFLTPPYHHQVVSFYLGVICPQFLFYLDMGLGKTKIVLDCFNFHRLTGRNKCLLVCVPNVIHVQGWIDEVALHAPNVKCVGLTGTGNEKWEQLGEASVSGADVIVATYDGLMWMLSNPLAGNRSAIKSARREKMVLNLDKIKVLRDVVDAVCLDEIHNVKNADTVAFKMCDYLSKGFSTRYGLTGTPFGRHPVDLWAPYYLVDAGGTFGPLNTFKAVFFRQRTGSHGYPETVFDKRLMPDLRRALRNRSIRFKDSECGDVPKHTLTVVRAPMSKEAREYQEVFRGRAFGGESNDDSKEVQFCFQRLRQIASGFIDIKQEEEDNVYIELDDNKLQALKVLVSEMPPDAKMAVFHYFVASGKRICGMLDELGIGYARAGSSVKGDKNKMNEVVRFNKDPDCRVFVLNSESASEGGNYQIADYLAYYESPVSPITRKQSFKRVVRGRKKHRTYVYDIVTKGSVDERILDLLKEGEDLFQLLIDGKSVMEVLGGR